MVECFIDSYLCITELNRLKCHLVRRMLSSTFQLVPKWQSLACRKKDGFSIFIGVRAGIAIATLCLAAGTAFILGPEYLRVNTPSVGTCWAKADGELYKPIACWSSEAVLKTVAYTNSASKCPSNSEWIFPPDATETSYVCLEETN